MASFTDDEITALRALFDSYVSMRRSPLQLLVAVDAFVEADRQVRAGNKHELPEQHREWILNFPTQEDQDRQRQAVTSKSLDQLWTEAIDSPMELSEHEADFLLDRYWANLTSEERQWKAKAPRDLEQGQYSTRFVFPEGAISPTQGKTLLTRLDEVQHALAQPKELQALRQVQQSWGPQRHIARAQEVCKRCMRPWMKQWWTRCGDEYEQAEWGYVVFFDQMSQKLLPGPYAIAGTPSSIFKGWLGGAMSLALKYLQAETIAARLYLQWETPPHVPHVVLPESVQSPDNLDLRTLRWHWPQHNATVVDDAVEDFRRMFRDKQAAGQVHRGLLPNTFLIVEPTCIHTVDREREILIDGEPAVWHGIRYYDIMRVIAVDADYPIPDREYPDGYRGYTWVRVQQLADKFFEMRWAHPDIGMEQIWQAAQRSKHQAFVSMDPEEAKSFTWSNDNGPLKGSLFFDTCGPMEAPERRDADFQRLAKEHSVSV